MDPSGKTQNKVQSGESRAAHWFSEEDESDHLGSILPFSVSSPEKKEKHFFFFSLLLPILSDRRDIHLQPQRHNYLSFSVPSHLPAPPPPPSPSTTSQTSQSVLEAHKSPRYLLQRTRNLSVDLLTSTYFCSEGGQRREKGKLKFQACLTKLQ